MSVARDRRARRERFPLPRTDSTPYAAPMRLAKTFASLVPLALAAVASAQAEKPPEVTWAPQTHPIIGFLIMAVLFGVIVTISLMPSKRSHTDL